MIRLSALIRTMLFAYSNRGLTNYDLKQFDQAIEDLNQAIRLNSNYAFTYTIRGLTHAALKQFGRAIEDYDQVIRLDPNYAAAYNGRGNAYLKLKKAQKGCADLKKACTLGECDGYEFAWQQKSCR